MNFVSHDPESLKKIAKEHSEKLAEIGMELAEMQFSYKVEKKPSKEYWQKRIDDFKKHNEKSMKYYNQAYSLMDLFNKEEAQIFLLHISKFRQLGLTLMQIMEKIKKNPSIIDSNNNQQSLWSKEIRDQITEHSNMCLQHEKDINASFRKFYEKHLIKILE